MSGPVPTKAWSTRAKNKGQQTFVDRPPRCECGGMFPYATHPVTKKKVCVSCLPR